MRTLQSITMLIALLFLQRDPLRAQAPTFTVMTSPVLDTGINCYYRYLPRNYTTDVTTKYPLMIFVHGVGECGTTAADYTKTYVNGPGKLMKAGTFPESFTVGGNTFRFIAFLPQIKRGLDYTAPLTDSIRPALIDAVIEYAKQNYRVDTTRIYLCGLSMGGGGTLHYAGSSLVLAKKLAAIVTACPARTISTAEANIIAGAKLPVLNTHNNDDGTVAASRSVSNMNRIKAYVPVVVPTPKALYWATGGHNVWTRTYENITAGSTAGGNVNDSIGINAYEWMLQFTRLSSLLPLSWKQFSADIIKNDVRLQWVVSQSTGVERFIVEKSEDGANWVATMVVAARQAGSINEQAYACTDVIKTGTCFYYRIKQIDADGKFTYSKVIKLSKPTALAVAGTVFPNPASKQFTVTFSGFTDNVVVVRVTNINGQQVFRQTISTNGTGSHSASGNLANSGKGTYYVTIENQAGSVLWQHQLIKQ